jgi:hypothetical protein
VEVLDAVVVEGVVDVPDTNVLAFSTAHDVPNVFLFATHANYAEIHGI